ncbi:hypothetical protein C8Q78DRAFT_1055907 [Trametes maxima]|nr:hypothetical protein C8Q78DRAFT_1055907 [Trametes maxima]
MRGREHISGRGRVRSPGEPCHQLRRAPSSFSGTTLDRKTPAGSPNACPSRPPPPSATIPPSGSSRICATTRRTTSMMDFEGPNEKTRTSVRQPLSPLTCSSCAAAVLSNSGHVPATRRSRGRVPCAIALARSHLKSTTHPHPTTGIPEPRTQRTLAGPSAWQRRRYLSTWDAACQHEHREPQNASLGFCFSAPVRRVCAKSMSRSRLYVYICACAAVCACDDAVCGNCGYHPSYDVRATVRAHVYASCWGISYLDFMSFTGPPSPPGYLSGPSSQHIHMVGPKDAQPGIFCKPRHDEPEYHKLQRGPRTEDALQATHGPHDQLGACCHALRARWAGATVYVRQPGA